MVGRRRPAPKSSSECPNSLQRSKAPGHHVPEPLHLRSKRHLPLPLGHPIRRAQILKEEATMTGLPATHTPDLGATAAQPCSQEIRVRAGQGAGTRAANVRPPQREGAARDGVPQRPACPFTLLRKTPPRLHMLSLPAEAKKGYLFIHS